MSHGSSFVVHRERRRKALKTFEDCRAKCNIKQEKGKKKKNHVIVAKLSSDL
jgi:hypothetical protein